MLELLLTLTRNTLPNNQEFLATNDVGQPGNAEVNWCRGIGSRANIIYILAKPVGAATTVINLYSYNITTNLWSDLGPTTTTLGRLDYVPTLVARSQTLLVFMALDIIYFYNILNNTWTLKNTLTSTDPGYMYGVKGWLYSGEIYRYGLGWDSAGNRNLSVQGYVTDTDKHRRVASDTTHSIATNNYAPTILVGDRLYYFAITGVVSYYDFITRRIVYTTTSVPVTTFNTLVEYQGNILIFGDSSGNTKVRLFNTSTNTVTLLSNPTLVSTARTFGVNLRENEINLYVGKRADPDVCNTLKYTV